MSRPTEILLLVEEEDGLADLTAGCLRETGIANPLHRVRNDREALDFVRRTGALTGRAADGHLLILFDV